MRVRVATAVDAGAIARVHIASWRAAYVGLIPQDFLDALDIGERTARWEAIFSADRAPTGALVLVADEGEGEEDRVVGFVHYGPTRDPGGDPETTGAVNALYLVSQVWRAGGGGALLEASERELRQAGLTTVTLWVLDGNEGAARFYERHGYTPDGSTNDRDWGSFVAHEVRYRKTL
jgi:GNAT superfamily N-acetyltransferase